ncbi:hypothetical protein [Pelomicrobium sp. G1]|uniref:hypothetical protein n=1 Tax=unclassified Pelomicrobium TaxID=2815318 RepID=UPI003F75888E
MKSREPSPKDEEMARLKAVVGELTMRLEHWREALRRLQGRAPFGAAEVEAMSREASPSTNHCYGVFLFAAEWQAARSTVYAGRGAPSSAHPAAPRHPARRVGLWKGRD